MPNFDGDPAEAEADIRRASDALFNAESELASAEARAEEIEQEPFDGSPEAEADVAQRMDDVQGEIESLKQAVADADTEHSLTIDRWTDEGYLPS